MNYSKLKKLVFISFLVLSMIFTGIFSTASAKIDYTAPIPLGAEVDLVEGLLAEKATKAIEAYSDNSSEVAQIERIYYNFVKSIDEQQYFAGAYWEGEPFLLDENGNQILDERGRPLKNYNRTFCILITDEKFVPKERLHSKLFFREVKYSYAQLEEFMNIVSEKLTDKGIIMVSTGDGLKENKINIVISSEYAGIEEEIIKLIPKDSFICQYEDPKEYQIVDIADVAVTNGSNISASGTPLDYEASIGFPVIWGSSSNRSKGWLTTGHFAYDGASVKWGAYTLGTLGNKNNSGNYDAATITKNVNSSVNLVSSPYIDNDVNDGVINYQESTSAGAIAIGTWITYYGAKTGWHTGTVSDNSVIANGVSGCIKVTGASSAVAEGDSGGPVWIENDDGTNTAVGIMKAKVTGTTGMIYTRLKYIRSGITDLSIAAFN